MKQPLFRFALVVTLFAVVSISSFAIFKYIKPNSSLKIPYSATDPSQQLSKKLEDIGVSLETPPAVLGDSIEASISGFKVLFSRSVDLGVQTRTLQLILPRLKMEGKPEKTIDLRFSKVIIR